MGDVGGWGLIEEKGNQREWRKQSRRVLAICHPTKDNSRVRAALFPVSPFLSASLLLIVKDITGQLQLRPLPSSLLHLWANLGINLKNGAGKAPLAIHSTSKGFIDSEQRGR